MCGGERGLGVRALNLTVPLGSGRVGSDNLGHGPGSGFSFEPVQTSNTHIHTHTSLHSQYCLTILNILITYLGGRAFRIARLEIISYTGTSQKI